MRLVFLYGPPAAGKLTVARELSRLTGLGVFHNHLVNDLAQVLYPWGSPPFGEFTDALRFQVFERALAGGVSLISTFVYAFPHDDGYVRKVRDYIEAGGGECVFAQVVCGRETLLERVGAESRRRFAKLKDPDKLRGLLEQYDVFTPIPFVDSLRVDTDAHSPEEAARLVAGHYGLSSPSSQG